MTLSQKKLLRLFAELNDAEQELLLAFTEFLHGRAVARRVIPQKPLPIPRPAAENVVSAIKRLSATYPMLAPERMFQETSLLMTSHLMAGRPALEVINDLENLFSQHFTVWQNEQLGLLKDD